MITTTNLSDFGLRELKELELLLKAMRENGLPPDFNDDSVTPMFNMNSGYVFLTNSDCQVAMQDNGKLYTYYSCPECGNEGAYEDLHDPAYHEDDGADCCEEYLKECRSNLYD